MKKAAHLCSDLVVPALLVLFPLCKLDGIAFCLCATRQLRNKGEKRHVQDLQMLPRLRGAVRFVCLRPEVLQKIAFAEPDAGIMARQAQVCAGFAPEGRPRQRFSYSSAFGAPSTRSRAPPPTWSGPASHVTLKCDPDC